MMNLALNISLTDEQYNELMSKTHDKLFESEEFINELTHVILSQIGQYLHDHPDEIRQALGITVSYYNRNATQVANNALMTKIIQKASDEYSGEISDNVKLTIKEIMKSTNLSDIIEAVLSKAILAGMSSGLTEHLNTVNTGLGTITYEVEQLKSRLGVN